MRAKDHLLFNGTRSTAEVKQRPFINPKLHVNGVICRQRGTALLCFMLYTYVKGGNICFVFGGCIASNDVVQPAEN
jgi:hypothetical protein